MRKSIFLLFLLLSSSRALAQYTNVTATVKDVTGALYVNCFYNVQFVNQSSLSQSPLLYGSVFQQTFAGARCDSSANLSIRLVDNNQITPLPSQWNFSICSSGGVTCFNTNVTITGASQDITASLQAAAATLPTSIIAKSQLPATTVYTDQANTFGAFLQKFKAGTNFNFVDSTDATKIAQFDLSNISTATTRTINVPNANSTLAQSFAAPANQFLTGMSAQGLFSATQPSSSNLSDSTTLITGSRLDNVFTVNGFLKRTGAATYSVDTNTYLTGNQTITLSGDVTGSGATTITTVVGNIPSGTTMAGSLLATNIAAPATPAAGKTNVYVDSTNKVFSSKNDAGTVSNTVVSSSAPTNQFASSISAAGVVGYAQPAFSNLSGNLGTAQGPSSLTGLLFDTAGTLSAYTTSGTGATVALNTSPTIATPTITGALGGNLDFGTSFSVLKEIANASVTGTTVNTLAKLTGAPSTAVITATTDTSGGIGVVVAGAGTTGNAQISQSGTASCVFDGATTAGDYVQISSTTAGDCHDSGSGYPTSGQVIGRVLSTNAAGGTYSLVIFPPEIKAAAASSTQSRSYLSADFATTSGTAINSGISFSVSANTTYTFSCNVIFQVANAAVSTIFFGFSGPASPNSFMWSLWESTSSADTTTGPYRDVRILITQMMGANTVAASNTNYPAIITAALENGANAGTLNLQVRNTDAATTVTLKRGSYCLMQ